MQKSSEKYAKVEAWHPWKQVFRLRVVAISHFCSICQKVCKMISKVPWNYSKMEANWCRGPPKSDAKNMLKNRCHKHALKSHFKQNFTKKLPNRRWVFWSFDVFLGPIPRWLPNGPRTPKIIKKTKNTIFSTMFPGIYALWAASHFSNFLHRIQYVLHSPPQAASANSLSRLLGGAAMARRRRLQYVVERSFSKCVDGLGHTSMGPGPHGSWVHVGKAQTSYWNAWDLSCYCGRCSHIPWPDI